MVKINLNDVIQHEDITFALCTFLDEFKRSTNKHEMIASPPQAEGADMKNLCMLAGTAHKLANDHGISIPDWVHDLSSKMPYPIYVFDTKNKEYQEFLLTDTPHEFSSKNMYVGSNAIDRV